MLIVGNWSYAGTDKFVSHAVMLSTTKPPRTLCGMDVYELLNRKGQQWETEELTGSLIVGCVKCNRHLTKRAPDAPKRGVKVVKSKSKVVKGRARR